MYMFTIPFLWISNKPHRNITLDFYLQCNFNQVLMKIKCSLFAYTATQHETFDFCSWLPWYCPRVRHTAAASEQPLSPWSVTVSRRQLLPPPRGETQQREQYHQIRPCATEKSAQQRPIDCQSTVKHLSVHNVHWRTVDCTVQVNNHDILWTVQITLTNREIDRTYGHFHRHQERTCELFCLFGLTTWQENHKRFFPLTTGNFMDCTWEKRGIFPLSLHVCVCVRVFL